MGIRLRRRAVAGPRTPIAPMIDVVFLLLIYFMVGATLEKQEADISFELPGVAEQHSPLAMPDEQMIEIAANGAIVVNERRYDTASDGRLIELEALLFRFHEASRANRVEPSVLIVPEASVPHQWIVRVLDACSAAGIRSVHFALGDEGG